MGCNAWGWGGSTGSQLRLVSSQSFCLFQVPNFEPGVSSDSQIRDPLEYISRLRVYKANQISRSQPHQLVPLINVKQGPQHIFCLCWMCFYRYERPLPSTRAWGSSDTRNETSRAAWWGHGAPGRVSLLAAPAEQAWETTRLPLPSQVVKVQLQW